MKPGSDLSETEITLSKNDIIKTTFYITEITNRWKERLFNYIEYQITAAEEDSTDKIIYLYKWGRGRNRSH